MVPPTRYGYPDSYKKAIEADDHDKWITAMEQEMDSLDRKQTWKLIDHSKDSKAIGRR